MLGCSQGVLGCSQGVEVLSELLGCSQECWHALRGVGVISGVLRCSQGWWVLSGVLRCFQGCWGNSMGFSMLREVNGLSCKGGTEIFLNVPSVHDSHVSSAYNYMITACAIM